MTTPSNITLTQRWQRLITFYLDREYYQRVFKLAPPFALQSLILSLLNMVGVWMLGQLGDTPVAAVGLANQIMFLLNLLLFGITSGAAMFTAQLWGKGDVPNIRKVLGLSISLSVASCLVFIAIAELAPRFALGIYSSDAAVIAVGSDYLRIFGSAFIFSAFTTSYSAVLRSIGEIKIPLSINIASLILNALLSYGLIFGVAGLPQMGVRGVAVAALIARILECAALLTITYYTKSPAAATLRDLFHFDFAFATRVLRPVLPVALNEMLWSLGVTTYNAIYGHISTEAVAAMSIAATIDGLALVVFIGIANACAILIGNQIGANDEQRAFEYGARTLTLAALGAILVSGVILVSTPFILTLYKVSPEVIQYTQKILVMIASFLWLRMMNLILFIGIFRSGGDTRFALILDGFIIWIVGVPMAFLGAFVFHLPVYWVYVFTMSEEFTKWVLGMFRFFSKKWIHNLAQSV